MGGVDRARPGRPGSGSVAAAGRRGGGPSRDDGASTDVVRASHAAHRCRPRPLLDGGAVHPHLPTEPRSDQVGGQRRAGEPVVAIRAEPRLRPPPGEVGVSVGEGQPEPRAARVQQARSGRRRRDRPRRGRRPRRRRVADRRWRPRSRGRRPAPNPWPATTSTGRSSAATTATRVVDVVVRFASGGRPRAAASAQVEGHQVHPTVERRRPPGPSAPRSRSDRGSRARSAHRSDAPATGARAGRRRSARPGHQPPVAGRARRTSGPDHSWRRIS